MPFIAQDRVHLSRGASYILSCLQDLVENGVEIKPDSDLVNDLGLESIKVMDLLMMLEDRFDISIPINILLDVKTPAQLMETLLPWLENN
ncbi:acyl carrier protein [Escherichia coli]|uniref:acyl carrier protein n=1 Tax=Escherichia coli TaxID=562 RepID=UPI000DDCA8DD|nr:acyl carrier protein [Escherichia coli]